MNYVGDFSAGSLVHIFFNTFDSNDPSASVTITNFIDTDVHIHKDDGISPRNNAAGVTVLVDIDSATGVHAIIIDTSNNTVADFFVAGSDYFVRIEGTTVDGATINAVVGSFSIENRHVAGSLLKTTINTVTSQTLFTLIAGSADDDAYNNCIIVISDLVATGHQKAVGRISDYVGSTKTITLAADPGIFTMATSDQVHIIATSALANVDSWLGTTPATPTVAGVPEVDMTHMEGGIQTVTDLKDFADAGYDPATNKVQGVVLVDTTTTNTDVRGTDNAALASVLGALADAAAAGDPTTADTVMQYLKQLINTLEGAVGIPTYPTAADPANDVSLAEAIRAIRDDVTAIAGSTMRGTDNAALASVATETRLSNLDAAMSTRATPAQVNTEVADVLKTDTVTLPGQVAPPLAPTFEEMISWLYKVLRNRKSQTSTQWNLFADNETTVDAKATVSDDTTTGIKQEIVSGP